MYVIIGVNVCLMYVKCMLNWRNLLQSGGDAGAGCHNRPLTQSLLSHDGDAPPSTTHLYRSRKNPSLEYIFLVIS